MIELKIRQAVYIVEKYLVDEKTGKKIPVYKKVRQALKKGKISRRRIKTVVIDGYEYTYHATKGWRKNKV